MGDSDQQIPAASNGIWSTQQPASGSIVTDFVHAPHTHSIRFIPSASPLNLLTFSSANNGAALNIAGFRANFYIYVVAMPTSGNFLWYVDTIYAEGVGIKLLSTGALQLWSMNNSVQVGGNSAAGLITTGQWYRISIAASQTSTSVNAYNLWVNGSLALGLTNVAMNSVTGSSFRITPNTSTSAGFDVRYSDMYCDDNTGLADPGNIYITAKRPVANGSLNQFTTQIGAGGSGYGSGHSPQVNERPLSITNGWAVTPVAVQTEEFTLEAINVGDHDLTLDTIIDYMGWASVISASTSNTPVQHIIVNGVASAVTANASAIVFRAFGNSAAYPTALNAIGFDAAFTTTGHQVSLYECGVQVAYLPAVPPDTVSFFHPIEQPTSHYIERAQPVSA